MDRAIQIKVLILNRLHLFFCFLSTEFYICKFIYAQTYPQA